MKLTVLLVCIFAAATYAACPNGCSGHGTCGSSDACSCYKSWSGGDCSLRSCPKGPSWSTVSLDELKDDRTSTWLIGSTPGGYAADTSNLQTSFTELYPKVPGLRPYVQCSGRGTCDHATGQCKCFAGYEGLGCRRTTCPNGCSGHGRCLNNYESNSLYKSFNSANDQQWDQKSTQQCVCDRGFTGYDCSSRLCPLGVDPTVSCGETSEIDRQLVRVTNDAGYFTLSFQDVFGGVFTTRPIKTNACSTAGKCNEVQFALMELPNMALPSIEVDKKNLGTTDFQNFVLTFSSPLTNGKQNTLTCNNVHDSTVQGASPMYVKSPVCHVYDVGIPEWFNAAGSVQPAKLHTNKASQTATTTKDFTHKTIFGVDPVKSSYPKSAPCANKGLCDAATATCKCANGHYGESCEKQSTFY